MYVGGADREFADPRLNEGFLRRVARDRAAATCARRTPRRCRRLAAGDRAAARRPRTARSLARAVGVRADRRAVSRSGSCAAAGGCDESCCALRRDVRGPRWLLGCAATTRFAGRALRARRHRRVGRRGLRGEIRRSGASRSSRRLREKFQLRRRTAHGAGGDAEATASQKATRENVRAALGDLRKRMTKDDQLLVLLIGHGTSTRRRRSQVQPGRSGFERHRVGRAAAGRCRAGWSS